MAIVQTGSTLTFSALGPANTGTVSTTITVPSDAEYVLAGWSGYSSSTTFFSTGSMTFTKSGSDTAMTYLGGQNSGNGWSGPLFGLVLPDTGTNKSLKWDWSGTGAAGDSDSLCTVTFWKGVDTASPVRASGTGSSVSNTPYTTGSIAGASGDLAVGWAGAFSTAEGTAATFSNLTLLTQITRSGAADGAWATGSPTGSSTYAVSTDTNWDDGALAVVTLKPASTSVTGTLAATETADSAAFAGSVLVEGSLAVTESADTAAFSGFVGVSGSLATTEATDTVSFAGSIIVSGSLSVTEAQDTAAFTGSVIVSGILAVTEGQDTAAFAGEVIVSGSLSTTETTDTAVFAGTIGDVVSGTLAATEATDIAAFTGDVLVSGILAVTENTDTASFSGSVIISGSLAVTENTDTASFDGTVGDVVSGTLAATEITDAASFTGSVVVSGALSTTEGIDTAAFSGSVLVSGSLSVTDSQDTAVFDGTVASTITGTFASTEAPDIAYFYEQIYGGGSWRLSLKPPTLRDDVKKAAAYMSSLGGQARAQALTPKQRSSIAVKAAQARWR